MLRALFINAGGFIAGIYVAQNYNLPNVNVFMQFALEWLKTLEENLRK